MHRPKRVAHRLHPLKHAWSVVYSVIDKWDSHNPAGRAAALSFYMVMAMPPLFVMLIFVAGFVVNQDTVRSQVLAQIDLLVGTNGGKAMATALAASQEPGKGGVASILAGATLLITSIGLFLELQNTLNVIWDIQPGKKSGVWNFLRYRLLSLALLVGVGFLLIVSLVVSTVLAALGSYLGHFQPAWHVFWVVVNGIVSFGIITILFAMIYKILPDTKIRWNDVWVGGALTAFLFTVGKFFIGTYLGHSSIVSAYGAAGSVVLILLWIYYSAQIFIFGAELTRLYADRYGSRNRS